MKIRRLINVGRSIFRNSSTLFVVLLSLLASACNDHAEVRPNTPQRTNALVALPLDGVTTKTFGLSTGEKVTFVAFKNRKAFEKTMAAIEPLNMRDVWEKAVKFKSMRTVYAEAEARGRAEHFFSAPPPDVEMPVEEQLATILSPEGVVQIGNHLFKLDKLKEAVYAVAVEDVNSYEDLVKGNSKNPEITVFSTDDEVLNMVEAEVKDKKAKTQGNGIGFFCGDNRAERRDADGYAYYPPNSGLSYFRGKCKHLYQKNGLWFKLFAKAKYQRQGTIFWRDELAYRINIYYYYTYKERCGGTGTDEGNKLIELDNKLEVVGYSGSNSLKEYSFVSAHTFINDLNTQHRYQAQIVLNPI